MEKKSFLDLLPYKGKWHLTKEFEEVNSLGHPTKIFTKEMEAYGFNDYMGIGDIIASSVAAYCRWIAPNTSGMYPQ